MKRLAMTVVFLAAFASGAFAASGSIVLYALPFDGTGTPACSGVLSNPFDTLDVGIFYATNGGPEMGKAAEFAIKSSTNKAFISNTIWSPAIGVTLGNPTSGAVITSSVCLGVGQTFIFLGTITIQANNIPVGTRFTLSVIPDPVAVPAGILVTLCEVNDPAVVITGGTFVFFGSCDIGVDQKTWGAIKELYR